MKLNQDAIKKVLPLLLIILFAGGSGFMVFNYLSKNSERLEKEYAEKNAKDLIEVIVANADLPLGTVTSPSTMSIRKIPKTFLPAGAITPDAIDQYFGRKLVTSMRGGTPLCKTFLENAVVTPFSNKIEPGLRAITLPVDEINSISGLVRAGDRMDLYLTTKNPFFKAGADRDDQIVVPILQNFLIHATGQLTQEETDNRNKLMAENSNVTRDRYSTITITVSQEDAQRLIMAQQLGKMTAVLRNVNDKSENQNVLSASALLGNPTQLDQQSIMYLIGGGGIKKVIDNGQQRNPAAAAQFKVKTH